MIKRKKKLEKRNNTIMRNIILIILTMWHTCSFAQPRRNGTDMPPKLIQSSPVVSNFVGWAYDSYKQRWSGYYNAIINIIITAKLQKG